MARSGTLLAPSFRYRLSTAQPKYDYGEGYVRIQSSSGLPSRALGYNTGVRHVDVYVEPVTANGVGPERLAAVLKEADYALNVFSVGDWLDFGRNTLGLDDNAFGAQAPVDLNVAYSRSQPIWRFSTYGPGFKGSPTLSATDKKRLTKAIFRNLTTRLIFPLLKQMVSVVIAPPDVESPAVQLEIEKLLQGVALDVIFDNAKCGVLSATASDAGDCLASLWLELVNILPPNELRGFMFTLVPTAGGLTVRLADDVISEISLHARIASGVATLTDYTLFGWTVARSPSTFSLDVAYNDLLGVANFATNGGSNLGARGPGEVVRVVAVAEDASGAPIEGAWVEWAVMQGGGQTSAAQLITDANGRATVDWQMGQSTGPAQLLVRTPGRVLGTTFSASVQQPDLVASPTSRSFSGIVGGGNPPSQTVTVGASVGNLSGLTRSVTYTNGSGWLTTSISPTSVSPNAPATLTIQPNTTSLAAGTYAAVVRVTAPGGASVDVDVSYVLSNQVEPVVVSQPASAVASNGFQLNGTVNPQGLALVSNFFELFSSSNCGGVAQTLALGDITSGTNTPVGRAYVATGLQAGTAYSYQLAARRANGPIQRGVCIGTSTTAIPPSVGVALTPNALALTPGGFGTTTVSLTRTNYTGSVTLTVPTSLPAGVTASITQPGMGSGGSVRFNLAVNHANFNNTPVTIRASGAGLTAVDAVVTLNLAASGSVAVALSPTSLVLTPGSFGTTTATLTRTNYTSSVSLAVITALPAGVTATITQPGTGSSGSVRFNLATSYANFSNLAVTVRATGTGLTAVDEVITLNVAGSSGVTMALSPTSLVLTPGSFGTTTATLTRSNFTGSVSLAVVTTLPAGLTATITQPGTGSTGSVRFNLATSYANFSNLAVTVRATGTGLTAVDEVITLNVAGSSGVTMALSPTSLVLTPGSFRHHNGHIDALEFHGQCVTGGGHDATGGADGDDHATRHGLDGQCSLQPGHELRELQQLGGDGEGDGHGADGGR